MVKAIEAIVILTLLAFSFFIGVKYSETVKSHASWLFETKEEEVDLPDLSNENGDIGAVEDSSAGVDSSAQEGSPMDSIEAEGAAATSQEAQGNNAANASVQAAPVAAPAPAAKAPVKK